MIYLVQNFQLFKVNKFKIKSKRARQSSREMHV